MKGLPPALRNLLEKRAPLAIAYSGGLDSRFLCHCARLCGIDLIAIHATGPHIAPAETQFARKWAEENNIRYYELKIDPLTLPQVAANGRDRCYFCKGNLFRQMKELILELGGGRTLCDGGNLDDGRQFRPGSRAANEEGVRSPLAESGLGKEDIKKIAAATGMSFPFQKARPCLLTRFAYGQRPARESLEAVARAEEAIAAYLTRTGLELDFRLRLLPGAMLQINPGADIKILAKILDAYGFPNAEIGEAASISGYFDMKCK